MLYSKWFRFFICSPILLVPFLSLWGPFQVHQLSLVSPSPSCSTAFLICCQGPSIYFVHPIVAFYYNKAGWNTYYYYYYYLLIRVFHISVSWWSFTGVRVTASLLKSPGLFSVFCPFSIYYHYHYYYFTSFTNIYRIYTPIFFEWSAMSMWSTKILEK